MKQNSQQELPFDQQRDPGKDMLIDKSVYYERGLCDMDILLECGIYSPCKNDAEFDGDYDIEKDENITAMKACFVSVSTNWR